METLVTLKPGEEDRLKRGHPWIYADEIGAVAGPGTPGGAARLASSAGEELGWGHYNPNGKIAFRRLGDAAPDRSMYLERLRAALAKREALFPGEDAYRLCFGESDGLPGLVVDRYGTYLVVQLLSAGMDAAWPVLQSCLEELLKPEGILLRNDGAARKQEGLPLEERAALGTIPPRVEIREGDLKLLVPLGSGQKTGYYFDQRQNRAYLAPFFKGKRVLDLHCYVGAFALKAAKSGARFALGMDSSGAAIELARANAKLNGVEKAARFEEGDAAGFMVEVARGPRGTQPDMILLDPPNFARSKADLPQALRAYARLFAKGLRCLPPNGLLAVSTCSAHVTAPVLKRLLEDAQRLAKRKAAPLAWRTQSEDHPIHPAMPETEYLHFGLLKVL